VSGRIIDTGRGTLQMKVAVRSETFDEWEVATEVTLPESSLMTLEEVRRQAINKARNHLREALDLLDGLPMDYEKM
jgi:hypothetical protein